ncbi:PMD domain-containing protein [Cephalotus follicularis]|uniref:PMD domain-containing protein n=1 Tax=Cephalotus follicularis TaxID=3775 RepID=A0A1Q3ANW2_CEPFO|nr:PMD domain-containing protein [Cephalotus follicularis]
MALKLAIEFSFSLAPVFLGTLYECLDQYHEAVLSSKGRYVHLSIVDTAFLHIIMWERFPGLAKPAMKSAEGEPAFRSLRWSGVKRFRNIQAMLDQEDKFCFRPYEKKVGGFKTVVNYLDADRLMNITVGNVSPHNQQLALMFLPSHVLAMVKEATHQSVVNAPYSPGYSPHIVAHQFGFNQGKHQCASGLNNVETVSGVFRDPSYMPAYPEVRELLHPRKQRVGKTTSSWLSFWKSTLCSFEAFIATEAVISPTDKTFVGEFLLQLPP